MTSKHNKPRSEFEKRLTNIVKLWTKDHVWLWFLPGIVLGMVLGFLWGISNGADVDNWFISGFWPEILSITITVGLLYHLDKWRDALQEQKRLKRELLWQVRSPVHNDAVGAIHRLRFENIEWLVGETGLLKNDKHLHDVQWDNANLRQANLENAHLERSSLVNTIFTAANLQNAHLQGANLAKALMGGANLKGANFHGASLAGAFLRGANLENASLYCSLHHANLRESSLKRANLQYAQMPNVDLRDADLRQVWGTQANLQQSRLRDAWAEKAQLSGINMRGSDLTGANFRDAHLVLADLQGSVLWATQFQGANLDGANITGADIGDRDVDWSFFNTKVPPKFDEESILPDGSKYVPELGLKQLEKFIDGSWYNDSDE